LHRGHQALARAAARECKGAPILLSFSGMAAVLGWAPRRPLVARQDRARVLDLWARELAAEGIYGQEAAEAAKREIEAMEEAVVVRQGAAAPSSGGNGAATATTTTTTTTPPHRPFPPVRQRYVPFASVRSLPPGAFVDLLRGQMRAAGAVAGANFRFGFKAAGDSAALSQLCAERGMRCAVVGLLMRRQEGQLPADDDNGAVSSSRVREQLAAGRVEAAARSLGRPHRVVFVVGVGSSPSGGDGAGDFVPLAPSEALRNQPPAEGEYRARVSCYPLLPADGGGGSDASGGQQQHHQDASLLGLETRQRAWMGAGRTGPPPARLFFEETRVRVDAEGGVSAEPSVARRCFGLAATEEGGGGGGVNHSFVLAVDFLGRSGVRWTPEVRTEDEE
jgi:FAD synthase